MGFRWCDPYYRLNAPMFGGKFSGNVLNVLLEPYLRRLRANSIQLLTWVDDLLMVVQPLPEDSHDAAECGGHASYGKCSSTRDRALRLEAEVDREMDALGLFTNEKRMSPARQGEFLCLNWDTARCVFYLTSEKAASLASKAADLASQEFVTPRQLAKFRGKLSWYLQCLEGVSLMICLLNKTIGAPASPHDWDTPLLLPSNTAAELSWWEKHLPSMAERAQPMWQLTGSQALLAFQAGTLPFFACLTTDASLHGWGAVLELRLPLGELECHSTSGCWLLVNNFDQSHREALAVPAAIRAFASLLHGRAVVLVSDCSCVVQAQEKGSKASEILQCAATETVQLSALHSFTLHSTWMAGAAMVASGVDELSRAAQPWLSSQYRLVQRPPQCSPSAFLVRVTFRSR